MSGLKYKVGDKVRIKSIDWYNENKDEYGYIDCGSRAFFTKMSDWCGKIATIKEICKTNCYHLEEYDFDWTDQMIEGLTEEIDEWILPEGFEFADENGNVINATKIVLKKKEKEYPKTYEECEKILGLEDSIIEGCLGYEYKLLNAFQKLLMCRDAYWKLCGDEMGLGKPWEPDWREERYIIYRNQDYIIGGYREAGCVEHHIFEFPTAEMRYAFYENFKKEIEQCKELL